jgi:hypothetical protein
MPTHLRVGGLVAAGFDPTGKFLLTVSHSGRGIFSVGTWDRIARDNTQAYPSNGHAIGIGPLAGQTVAVTEKDYETGELQLRSLDGVFELAYDSGVIAITSTQP